tara:strand:+ start:1602 stop:1724 length:123 start_codon:yes stop_codon:yes gene_type:complete
VESSTCGFRLGVLVVTELELVVAIDATTGRLPKVDITTPK